MEEGGGAAQGEKGAVDERALSWANVKAHETATQHRGRLLQLEWSQALFPARHRRVEEVGGLFIDWPQHKHAH